MLTTEKFQHALNNDYLLARGNIEPIKKELMAYIYKAVDERTDLGINGFVGSLLHILVMTNRGSQNNREIGWLLQLDPTLADQVNGERQSPLDVLILTFESSEAEDDDLPEEYRGTNNCFIEQDVFEETALLLVRCSEKEQIKLFQYCVFNNTNGRYKDLIQQLMALYPRLIDVQDEQQETILHRAIRENNVELVQLLLANYADYTLTNSVGQTALDLANIENNQGIMQLLPQTASKEYQLYLAIRKLEQYGHDQIHRGNSEEGQVHIEKAKALRKLTDDFIKDLDKSEKKVAQFKGAFTNELVYDERTILTKILDAIIKAIKAAFVSFIRIFSSQANARSSFFAQDKAATSEKLTETLTTAMDELTKNIP